ncbi:hypothetical protein [Corynebacterium sp. 13CS0277]|nr:hypothetical protein [Corynebacterium sp. 13CS0277]
MASTPLGADLHPTSQTAGSAGNPMPGRTLSWHYVAIASETGCG